MVGRFFARIAIGIAMVLIALVAAFVAVGFFALAVYELMLEYLSPPLAALACGVAILVIAMLLVLTMRWTTSPRRGLKRDSPSLEACESAAELGSVLGRRLQGLAEAHGSGALWASVVAGFVVGVSPKLRKFLVDILKF